MLPMLRVLMIGNSFSICVGTDLPPIVNSVPDCAISLTSAYIGGCQLDRHWNNVLETRENPDAKQYRVCQWDAAGEGVKSSEKSGSINELIEKGDWDVVTIQQASHQSWDYATYQPFASNLVAYVRERNPKAKILIQQTWAYRSDDGRIRTPEPKWGFDQNGFHERLTESYGKLSRDLGGLDIIPTGRAVWLSRQRDPAPFTPYTPEYLASVDWPGLPSQMHDVVGNVSRRKNAEGEFEFSFDTIHLNGRGHYLQACVWFEKLFGKPVPEDAFVPGDVGAKDAAFLRACAHDACVQGYDGKAAEK